MRRLVPIALAVAALAAGAGASAARRPLALGVLGAPTRFDAQTGYLLSSDGRALLVRVVGKLTDDVDPDDSSAVLKADYYRH